MGAHPGGRVVHAALSAAIYCICSVAAAGDSDSEPVQFNRDIRPILSERCFTCHGPDKANRKTNMHFDTDEGALTPLASGGFAIVRGNLSKSVMYQRISSDNEAFRMPPAYFGLPKLPDREIELIRRWIEQGAQWQKHWSFIPPERPPLPHVTNKEWPRNPIDSFVLARLEREGLTASPEADRVTLIRRLTLDLTGLPPKPAEVDGFLNDRSPDAYEKVVDRLLGSPRYAENMAWQWLDAARYADTNGYQSDGVRSMWRWGGWGIDAFNPQMPLKRVPGEQLPGGLFASAPRGQVISTRFNRTHTT